jgi:cyclohexyl-isocyanide hydratase
MTTHIGMVLFPGLTQLDLTGPYEVFARMPDTTVHLVAASIKSVVADSGLRLKPTTTFADCPQLDVIFVPGGKGIHEAIKDEHTLEFLRRQAVRAKFVTSVCTGALVLGAAGLLKGYRATTHWLSVELLPIVGAIPVRDRVVMDRNRITGGGVTAGIDFGLVVAAQLSGPKVAKEIQLVLEYNPAPPFDSGSPERAAPALVERLKKNREKLLEERRRVLEEAMK